MKRVLHAQISEGERASPKVHYPQPATHQHSGRLSDYPRGLLLHRYYQHPLLFTKLQSAIKSFIQTGDRLLLSDLVGRGWLSHSGVLGSLEGD